MIDFTGLPSSLAEPIEDMQVAKDFHTFTFTGYMNEKTLYTDISTKLHTLETSLDADHEELDTIICLAEQLQFAHEEKEEVITRINWLQRLYKAKVDIRSVDTNEKLKQLRNLISPVQTCPLKKQLLDEMDRLEASLQDAEPSARKEPIVMELLMEKAFGEAGDMFINLGKAGREYVVSEVWKQHGDEANIDHVRKCASQLEERVNTLTDLKDRNELIAELDQLPLIVYSSLDAVRKERIAERLMNEKEWAGLYSLDRRIKQVNDTIDKEERVKYEKENVIELPDGKAASTIDVRFTQID